MHEEISGEINDRVSRSLLHDLHAPIYNRLIDIDATIVPHFFFLRYDRFQDGVGKKVPVFLVRLAKIFRPVQQIRLGAMDPEEFAHAQRVEPHGSEASIGTN